MKCLAVDLNKSVGLIEPNVKMENGLILKWKSSIKENKGTFDSRNQTDTDLQERLEKILDKAK